MIRSKGNPSLNDLNFAWYGQRTFDCFGLEKYLNIDLIMSCDFGLDTPLLLKRSASSIYSVEEKTFTRENWTSAFLDKIIEADKKLIIEKIKSQSKPTHIIAYSATRTLTDLASHLPEKIRLIMPSYELKAWLDNKLTFRKILSSLGLSTMPSFTGRLGSINFHEAKDLLGLPFVINLEYGSAGSGTFFIHSESEFENLSKEFYGGMVLISKYIDSISLNINGAIIGENVVVANPSIQLLGFPECTNRPEVYCGNDFSATLQLPSDVLKKADESVRIIGRWLRSLGYQGMFGVDLLTDLRDDSVYPVDLNPRYQNSTHLLTMMEIAYGLKPLSLISLEGQLGLLQDNKSVIYDSVNLYGSQIILHSLENSDTIVRNALAPGVYAIESDEKIIKKKDGLSLLDLEEGHEEFVISCGIPRIGTTVKPGAPLLKIFMLKSVLTVGTRFLDDTIRKLCTQVYKQLMLEPVSKGN